MPEAVMFLAGVLVGTSLVMLAVVIGWTTTRHTRPRVLTPWDYCTP